MGANFGLQLITQYGQPYGIKKCQRLGIYSTWFSLWSKRLGGTRSSFSAFTSLEIGWLPVGLMGYLEGTMMLGFLLVSTFTSSCRCTYWHGTLLATLLLTGVRVGWELITCLHCHLRVGLKLDIYQVSIFGFLPRAQRWLLWRSLPGLGISALQKLSMW